MSKYILQPIVACAYGWLVSGLVATLSVLESLRFESHVSLSSEVALNAGVSVQSELRDC